MEQVFTAIIISVFMMMSSALYVLIWDVLDTIKMKNKIAVDIGLEPELHQKIVDFLEIDEDDMESISKFIETTVIEFLTRNSFKE